MKFGTRFVALAIALLLGLSAAAHAQNPRVLIVGDSWAWFMWQNRSLREVFSHNGLSILEKGDLTAVNGSTAEEWVSPAYPYLGYLTSEIQNNPTIDVVHLSIGGNDMLNNFSTSLSPAQLEALSSQIISDTNIIVNHALSLRPDISVVIQGYDYPNFRDAGIPACTGRWNAMGQPTPLQINTLHDALETRKEAFFSGRPRVTYVNNVGLMQFRFGFPSEGSPPYTLLPPGDLTRPSPREAMFLPLGIADCIHLNEEGYLTVAKSAFDSFYRQKFGVGLPLTFTIQQTYVPQTHSLELFARVREQGSSAITSGAFGWSLLDAAQNVLANGRMTFSGSTLLWTAIAELPGPLPNGQYTVRYEIITSEIRKGSSDKPFEVAPIFPNPTLILAYLKGLSGASAGLDANSDGKVDAGDLLLALIGQ